MVFVFRERDSEAAAERRVALVLEGQLDHVEVFAVGAEVDLFGALARRAALDCLAIARRPKHEHAGIHALELDRRLAGLPVLDPVLAAGQVGDHLARLGELRAGGVAEEAEQPAQHVLRLPVPGQPQARLGEAHRPDGALALVLRRLGEGVGGVLDQDAHAEGTRRWRTRGRHAVSTGLPRRGPLRGGLLLRRALLHGHLPGGDLPRDVAGRRLCAPGRGVLAHVTLPLVSVDDGKRLAPQTLTTTTKRRTIKQAGRLNCCDVVNRADIADKPQKVGHVECPGHLRR